MIKMLRRLSVGLRPDDRIESRTIRVIMLTAVALAGAMVAGAGEERSVSLEKIAVEYEAHLNSFASLSVQYREIYQPLVSMEVLIGMGYVPMSTEPGTVTVCQKGNKLYYSSLVKRYQVDRVLNDMARENPAIKNIADLVQKRGSQAFLNELKAKPLVSDEHRYIYDGSLLFEMTPNGITIDGKMQDTYAVNNAQKRGDIRYLPTTYFEWICYGVEDPSGSDKRDHIPRMFTIANFDVKAEEELIEGCPCTVLEAAGKQKLWLDPKRGFAVMRRRIWYDGKPCLDVTCRNLVELQKGVWLPRTVERDVISRRPQGQADSSEVYENVLRVTQEVIDFQVNAPDHESLFVVSPKPGSWITFNDRSRQVVYEQPLDSDTLKKLVGDTQRSISPPAWSIWDRQRALSVLLACAVMGLLGVGIRAVWKRRQASLRS